MKSLTLLLFGLAVVGCTSTRIDDHSYHYSHTTTPAPVNINNYNTYKTEAPARTWRRTIQDDEDFIQYQPAPSSYRGYNYRPYRGLHVRVDQNNERTVVPASWNDVPRYSIPPGNAGIPVLAY